ncbi:MAG TPA: TetR/AcrR family transcriptional regulator [Ilumatobacter sp.]|nr:TetR/AcrR family transcriptional regulator [Ilumatobacter sp.]
MSTDGGVGHTEMQQALLDAALAVLREQGAAGLTVRNITARAGCSTSAIYTHFGGKQGLVEAIYLDGFESFDRHVSGCLGHGVERAGSAYRAWALANPTHYLVMWGRAVPDFEPSEVARDRAFRSFQQLVDAFAAAGAAAPVPAAYHAWATMHGYVMLELVGIDLTTIEQRAAMYDHALAALAGDR